METEAETCNGALGWAPNIPVEEWEEWEYEQRGQDHDGDTHWNIKWDALCLNTDQMPAEKDNCRKADIYAYLGQRNKTWQGETVYTKQFLTVEVNSQICNRKGVSYSKKNLQQRMVTLFTKK